MIFSRIEKLGVKHLLVGVQTVHFEVFRSAILFTIEEILGKEYSNEIKQSWSKAFELLSGIMLSK
jgi:hemoglobin-like flavoprotein